MLALMIDSHDGLSALCLLPLPCACLPVLPTVPANRGELHAFAPNHCVICMAAGGTLDHSNSMFLFSFPCMQFHLYKVDDAEELQ